MEIRININAEPKEIAALVLELQERPVPPIVNIPEITIDGKRLTEGWIGRR